MLTPKKTLNRTKGTKEPKRAKPLMDAAPRRAPAKICGGLPCRSEQPSHHGFRQGEADDLRRQAYPYLISVDAPALHIKGQEGLEGPVGEEDGSFRTARSENDPVGKNVPEGLEVSVRLRWREAPFRLPYPGG